MRKPFHLKKPDWLTNLGMAVFYTILGVCGYLLTVICIAMVRVSVGG